MPVLDVVRSYRRPLLALAVLALLAQMAYAMVTTAREQTPTIDEPVYVGAAVVQYQQHSLRYNPEHPPLGKLIMAIGLAHVDPVLDPAFEGDQGELGRHLLYQACNDPWRIMLWARLPIIVLTLLFGLVVFAFARDVAGPVGALVALALYTFSPDLIAHGSLATLDVPGTGFLLTALWLLWRARRRPRLYLPFAALALGAALATKTNALPSVALLLPLVMVSVWYAGRRPDQGRRGTARLLGLGVAAAVGVAVVAAAVVWASYLAVDPRLTWTTPAEVPVIGGLRGQLVDWLPFPEPYRDGMRIQFGYEDTPFGTFLFGNAYRDYLWFYLPAALLVKTPLGMLALWVAGAVALIAVPRLRPAALYLLIPTLALLAVAMAGTRNLGTRYALFVPMFLAVAAAAVVVLRRRWQAVTAALVAFVAVSSLHTFPYYLPYSNEAFGGTAKTHLRLHDSNVDWGQDLGRLADHLRERYPGQTVWLVYKGSGEPDYYGIKFRDPLLTPLDEVHGLLVVSNSAAAKAGRSVLATLVDSSEPIDQVGHSITIYRR
ncbi:glycosyltransferase family 39 protein [Phytohabitans rumicis]|uniref:Glycosyl transferase n=1 Tax=Phytohabitans rumicis TaxID=1076125 RepID=A0A6V8LG47_9ACTN|nr:glycosyltransferase family 39 protein [Phytohabitans rumicis]GFJ93037.1 glycosyl transferase [Phytohabitans rumicis]